MVYTVAIGEYEGPLGMLLQLVERGKMQVETIAVSDITQSYLAALDELAPGTPETMAEFLELGARLLYIKSLALLPGDNRDEQTQELWQLQHELAEYQRFQAAANLLASRTALQSWERPVSETLSPSELPLPNITLTSLTQAFAEALRRVPAQTPAQIVPRAHISLETVLQNLRQKLSTSSPTLRTILDDCPNGESLVVHFLALLELMREGAANVRQAHAFGPIQIEAAHV